MEKIATDICSFENLRKSGYVYVDLEYEKLNSAGKLGMIELPKGAYVSARYRHDLIEGNSLKVVSSILEQDKLLCMRCLGVPIEWLAEAMRCPEPSYRSDLVKKTFPRAVIFRYCRNVV